MVKLPDELTPKSASRAYGGQVEGYRDGWNACLAELQRLNATAQPVSDGWVKCSERMPPIGKRVLIPTSGLKEAIEAVRFESNKFNRFGVEVVADYWMPLPAAPGGQDEQ